MFDVYFPSKSKTKATHLDQASFTFQRNGFQQKKKTFRQRKTN